MKEEASCRSLPPLFVRTALVLLVLLIPSSLVAVTASKASVQNLEIASVAGDGALGNGGSFYVTTSLHGRYVTFESLATNLTPAPAGTENWADIYLHDRVTGQTYKVSKNFDGGPTNEASVDPSITDDGEYVAYFSYASNIIPNDTNHQEYNRTGLDVFVWDRDSGVNTRVSLNEHGKEIDGNSVGSISADGKYILFVSDGRVFDNDWDKANPSALYLRDWRSGSIERISKAMNGGFPNGDTLYESISRDHRYVVYGSEASNLTAGDSNGEMDVFLYDRQSGVTKLISRDAAGRPANGRSSQPEIAPDGKSIVFLSYANNLVPGDTNGHVDIFVYDLTKDDITLVSKAENGAQANGDSREPSTCGDGRFISYTTEATNLFANDNNNERDVILYDRLKGTNSVATISWAGELGNGKAHRSFLVPDCHAIAFASDASNLVVDDTNNARDIFIGDIHLPADFSHSAVRAVGAAQPGQVITYSLEVRNSGYEAATATLLSPIPANTTYLPGSASAGGSYNVGENRVEWQGTVNGSSSQLVSFAVVVDGSLTEATLLTETSVLTGDGGSLSLTAMTVVNGFQVYVPLVSWK